MRRIDNLHLEYPFMGARMFRDQLVREYQAKGCTRVGILMKRMGIAAVYRKPKTSRNYPGLPWPQSLSPSAVRYEHPPVKPGMGLGYDLYSDGLTVVIDWASRKVLALKVAITPKAYTIP